MEIGSYGRFDRLHLIDTTLGEYNYRNWQLLPYNDDPNLAIFELIFKPYQLNSYTGEVFKYRFLINPIGEILGFGIDNKASDGSCILTGSKDMDGNTF